MKNVKRNETLTVGLLGNPNCGKTTLFNALTGSHVKAANWPGVTVERMEGELIHQNVHIKLVDLPGIYSLDSGSMEEKVSTEWLESGEADVVINVVNATALERNLYLTAQLLEHKVPITVALNLMDAAERQGIKINTDILSAGLEGAYVVPISARKRSGLDCLLDRVVEAGNGEQYDVRNNITLNRHRSGVKCNNQRKNNKYQFAEELSARAVTGASNHHRTTDCADRFLTHPIWGIPLFCIMMAAVFSMTFAAGDWLKGYLELALGWLIDSGQQLFSLYRISEWVSSLVFDGIITGVGGILTFLPNLLILYISLAFLEDSGYMARAAYVMNETMGLLEMTGKAFLPLILGFGCTVPAAAATGALENRQEKRKALGLLPFMSCSAKMPIYILFAGAFFGRYAVFVTYVLCVAGAVLGLVLCWLANRKSRRREGELGTIPQRGRQGEKQSGGVLKSGGCAQKQTTGKCANCPFLLLELPDYRMPSLRTVWIYVWEKVKDYVVRAGSVIFIASMILWFLMGYGPGGAAGNVEESFAALLGKMLVSIFRPAGFGIWQLCVALICGLSAKEVVVSACMVLFRVQEAETMAEAAMARAAIVNGGETFQMALTSSGLTSAGALAFMVFCLLYSPCVAAVAAIRKESGSAIWTAGLVVKQTVMAWIAAVVVFQVAGIFL